MTPVTGRPVPYFAGGPLHHELAATAKAAAGILWSCGPGGLLSRPEDGLAEELVALASFEPPALARDKAYLEAPCEVTEPGERAGQPVQAIFTRYTLVVPVTGQASLLETGPATWLIHWPVRGEIDRQAKTLKLRCDGIRDPGKLKAHFEYALDRIEEHVAGIRAGVEAHNQQMARQLPVALAGRKAKLLEDREIQAGIGYRLQRRPDAGSHNVAVRRRTLAPQRRPAANAPASLLAPEPALDDADYEAALAVLRNARNTLERSPSMTAKLDEEEVRDLPLMGLNTQFEGKAGGEVFNYAGKTDILIREGDRNVYIGECKIYDPAHKQSIDRVITGALSQLLGYLPWRDTKAALLLFIRDADVSAVTEKALMAIEATRTTRGRARPAARNATTSSSTPSATRTVRSALCSCPS